MESTETLMLLLLIPMAWPFIAKRIWKFSITWAEVGINIVVPTILVAIVWQLGIHSATDDTEIWNGYVLKKERIHDHYLDPYDCMCTTDDDGYETCQTCYEDRYTVTWRAETTVGNITFDHLDSSSRSVYNRPDPVAYAFCRANEPASIEHGYVNYVKAVPDTLFREYVANADPYAEYVPPYPQVYDFYKIKRVIGVDSGVPKQTKDAINVGLDEALKTLGASKQVNIIVILTSIADPAYRYSVEGQWLGAKKNDVVVFIGVDDQMNITWTDTMTWAMNSGNELFHVKMVDGVKKLESLDPSTLVPFITNTVEKHFDRPYMKDYEYLKGAIKPPLWLIITALIIGILSSFGLTYVFHRNEFSSYKNSYR